MSGSRISVTIVLVALLVLSCGRVPSLLPAPLDKSESSTVAILRPQFRIPALGEFSEPFDLEYQAGCAGVAISPRLVATAAHCRSNGFERREARVGDAIGYVSRSDWFLYSDLVEYGTVSRVGPGDSLLLRTERPLEDWAVARMPVVGEPVTIVNAVHDYEKTGCHVVEVSGRSFVIRTHLREGMSGAPAFGSDGRLLGLAVRCSARGGVCTGPGEFEVVP